jgi:hypothetical protein
VEINLYERSEFMGLIENVKEVVGVLQKADNIDLYRKVLDLQKDALDLIEENRYLKNQVKQLEESLTIISNIEFKDNMYFTNINTEDEKGPFCTKCWDDEKKLVRLHFNGLDFYLCPVCQNSVTINNVNRNDNGTPNYINW